MTASITGIYIQYYRCTIMQIQKLKLFQRYAGVRLDDRCIQLRDILYTTLSVNDRETGPNLWQVLLNHHHRVLNNRIRSRAVNRGQPDPMPGSRLQVWLPRLH